MAPSAELMLGLRAAAITRQDVRAALWEQRTLVKTVALRGALHLLPAEEVPLWMAANRLRFEAEERLGSCQERGLGRQLRQLADGSRLGGGAGPGLLRAWARRPLDLRPSRRLERVAR